MLQGEFRGFVKSNFTLRAIPGVFGAGIPTYRFRVYFYQLQDNCFPCAVLQSFVLGGLCGTYWPFFYYVARCWGPRRTLAKWKQDLIIDCCFGADHFNENRFLQKRQNTFQSCWM